MRLSSTILPTTGALILIFAVTWGGKNHANAQGYRSSSDRMVALVSPSRQVLLGAPVTGLVAEKLVDDSDFVREGVALMRLDDRLQQISVQVAEMEIGRQNMRRDEAELQYEQAIELRKTGTLNEWEYRQRDLALKIAQGEVERAEKALELEKARLAMYTIRAPFDGHVERTAGELGQSLRQGDPVMTMIDLDPLEAVFDLPVEMYGNVSAGQVYELIPEEAPIEGPLQGRVKSIEPKIDNASRTFRAVLEIANPESALPTGFKVRMVQPSN